MEEDFYLDFNDDNDETIYLTEEELLAIHFSIMEWTNDISEAGVKYPDRFESCIKRPQTDFFGNPQYPTIFEKAGAFFHSLCKDHIFYNGNKRTALAALITFLEVNGYEFLMDQGFAEDFTVRVAEDDVYNSAGAAEMIAVVLHDCTRQYKKD